MKTILSLLILQLPLVAATPDDGSVLPFPPASSASIAGQTLQESTHKRRVEPGRLELFVTCCNPSSITPNETGHLVATL